MGRSVKSGDGRLELDGEMLGKKLKLSEFGEVHILLKVWKAILSGNKGPAVAQKTPPETKVIMHY